MARKAYFEVYGELLCPVFNPEKTRLCAKAYLCASVIQALFSFISCMWAAFTSYWLAHVVAERQTNTQTYIHTFQKAISKNQAQAQCQLAVGACLV